MPSRYRLSIMGRDCGMLLNFADHITRAHRARILIGSFLFAVVVAATTRLTGVDLSVLFLAPLLVSALFLPPWQVFGAAIAVTLVREHFGVDPWGATAVSRLVISLISFSGPGLF